MLLLSRWCLRTQSYSTSTIAGNLPSSKKSGACQVDCVKLSQNCWKGEMKEGRESNTPMLLSYSGSSATAKGSLLRYDPRLDSMVYFHGWWCYRSSLLPFFSDRWKPKNHEFSWLCTSSAVFSLVLEWSCSGHYENWMTVLFPNQLVELIDPVLITLSSTDRTGPKLDK